MEMILIKNFKRDDKNSPILTIGKSYFISASKGVGNKWYLLRDDKNILFCLKENVILDNFIERFQLRKNKIKAFLK